MRLPTILSVVAVSLLSVMSVLEQWVRGYFILFMPFGFYTPLVNLTLSLALIISGFAATIFACRGEPSKVRRAFVVACFLTIVCLPWLTSWQLHGFESRVSQTTDREWLQIADEARSLIRSSTPDGRLPRGTGNETIGIDGMSGSWPTFTLSSV